MSDWFDEGGSGSPVDVGAMFDSKAMDLLCDAVAMGALVSMGKTSDGGALGVTITVDGRWRREYFRETEALQLWLEEAGPAISAATQARASSSGRGQRQRRSRGL